MATPSGEAARAKWVARQTLQALSPQQAAAATERDARAMVAASLGPASQPGDALKAVVKEEEQALVLAVRSGGEAAVGEGAAKRDPDATPADGASPAEGAVQA